jgi:hypothetical protein
MERSVGRYCQWFNTDISKNLGKPQASVKVKFGDGDIIEPSDNHLLATDRSKFDYSEFPTELFERDTDFVYFVAEQKGKGRSFWNFVLANDKLDELEENSKDGSRVQLFDISFDSSIQRDPNVNIFSNDEPTSGLLFHSECARLVGLGIVEHHRSITASEYEKITGNDPVMLFAKQNYYDPIYQANYSERMTFDEFSEQQLQRFA